MKTRQLDALNAKPVDDDGKAGALASTSSIDTVDVPRCPLCGAERHTSEYSDLRDAALGVRGTWSFRRCVECRLVYLRPIPARLVEAYPEHYSQHAPGVTSPEPSGRVKRGIRAAVLTAYGYPTRHAWPRSVGVILKRYPQFRIRSTGGFPLLPPGPPSGALVDVGCGNGRFVSLARHLGWNAVGVESDPKSAGLARELIGDVVYDSFDAARESCGRFDVVTLNHVLEHVADPLGLLHAIRDSLAPGGRVGIAVPNWTSLLHRIFRRHWSGLEHPRHVLAFDLDTLVGTVERAGFRVIARTTVPALTGQRGLQASWRNRYRSPVPRSLEGAWPYLSGVATLFLPSLGEEALVWAVRRMDVEPLK